jgi:aspartate/methionine/tyrosine aminotransferase
MFDRFRIKPWSSQIEAQPMFDILEAANAQSKVSGYVARMEIGDTPGFKNLAVHKLIAQYAEEEFRYAPSKGDSDFIATLFSTQWPRYSNIKYDIAVAPANFLITAALASITSRGDSVLLPNPGFPTYRLAANFLGLKILYYSPSDFLPDSSLKSRNDLISKLKNAKVIVINNPSNPTGINYDGSVYSDILNKFEKVEVISDETYVNLVYDNSNPLIDLDKCIRIRSFSKEHCAPGLRIGYVLAELKTIKIISDFISLSISCSPKFIQLALNDYLNSIESLDFVNKLRNSMKSRINHLVEHIAPEHIPIIPNGAFYAFLKVSDDEKAFKFLLENNIATCPGTRFGSNGFGFLRISLAGSEEYFFKDIENLGTKLTEFEKLGKS